MSCTSAPRSKWATSSSEWDLVASSPTSEHFYSGLLSILTPAVTLKDMCAREFEAQAPRLSVTRPQEEGHAARAVLLPWLKEQPTDKRAEVLQYLKQELGKT